MKRAHLGIFVACCLVLGIVFGLYSKQQETVEAQGGLGGRNQAFVLVDGVEYEARPGAVIAKFERDTDGHCKIPRWEVGSRQANLEVGATINRNCELVVLEVRYAPQPHKPSPPASATMIAPTPSTPKGSSYKPDDGNGIVSESTDKITLNDRIVTVQVGTRASGQIEQVE